MPAINCHNGHRNPVGRRLFVALLLIWSSAHGSAPIAKLWHDETSEDGRILVESFDTELNSALLKIIEDQQEWLGREYGLRFNGRSHLHVRISDWDYHSPHPPPVLSAWQERDLLNLQLTIIKDPHPSGNTLMRKIVEASLYQYIYQDGAGTLTSDHLARIPTWLLEGFLQSVSAENANHNLKIVLRTHSLKKTPTLESILGWEVLSNDFLERAWQEAHCFQLLQFARVDPVRWTQLKKWLIGLRDGHAPPPNPWVDEAQIEANWSQFLSDPKRSEGPIIFSWERTATELAAAQSIVVPAIEMNSQMFHVLKLWSTQASGNTSPAAKSLIDTKHTPSLSLEPKTIETQQYDEVLTRLDQLTTYQTHPGCKVAIAKKVSELTVLESRAHFSWRPVVQAYRYALLNLQRGDLPPGAYEAQIADAERKATLLNGLSTRITDYLNWFEVTKYLPLQGSDFESSFRLLDNLDGFNNRLESESENDMIKLEKKL